VILVGGLLAAGYVFRVLALALAAPEQQLALRVRVERPREAVVLALAICALLLGFLPLRPSALLQVGQPGAARVAAAVSAR
jgi:hypothetical protein